MRGHDHLERDQIRYEECGYRQEREEGVGLTGPEHYRHVDAVNVELGESHNFHRVTLDDEEEERPDHKGHLSHLQFLRWGDQRGLNLDEQEGDEPTEDF